MSVKNIPIGTRRSSFMSRFSSSCEHQADGDGRKQDGDGERLSPLPPRASCGRRRRRDEPSYFRFRSWTGEGAYDGSHDQAHGECAEHRAEMEPQLARRMTQRHDPAAMDAAQLSRGQGETVVGDGGECAGNEAEERAACGGTPEE